MKVGHSDVGAVAASSHTASLAGEDVKFTMQSSSNAAPIARTPPRKHSISHMQRGRESFPVGKRLGLVTMSGGAGVLMADAAADCGLDVAEMPAEAQAEMKALLPFAAPRNPVDVTAQILNDMTLVPRFTRLMLDRGNYDALIGFWSTVGGAPKIQLGAAQVPDRGHGGSGQQALHAIADRTTGTPQAVRGRRLPVYRRSVTGDCNDGRHDVVRDGVRRRPAGHARDPEPTGLAGRPAR